MADHNLTISNWKELKAQDDSDEDTNLLNLILQTIPPLDFNGYSISITDNKDYLTVILSEYSLLATPRNIHCCYEWKWVDGNKTVEIEVKA